MSAREAEEAADAAAPIDLLSDLLQTERSELVAAAMRQLPVLQRDATVLSTFEELPISDIARIPGVDVGTVKSRLHRARESLRSALASVLARQTERRCS
ncbi:MAG TPA: sigma factor-like helix-turn-helix DNA-binding protein [Bryobacteraceae bacterium]|nr:sigma factor-like helix-turn-helix DNA-binding protein [Bryobacteraceae bacterium]